MNFFSDNGGSKFFRFATKLSELMWLNILTFICCIPIITVGSAFTAMHTVLVQIYRDDEDKITRSFFSAFKKNFGQSTLIWLIYMAFYGLLLVENWAMRALGNPTLKYLEILVPVLAFIGALSLCWVFVLQSRYKLTLKDTIVYSFTRIIAFPIRTLFMAVTLIVPLLFVLYVPQMAIVVFVLGITGPGILSTCFYNYALRVMEDDISKKKPDEETEEAET